MNNSNDKIPNNPQNENTIGFEFEDKIQDAWNPNDGQFFIGNSETQTQTLTFRDGTTQSRNSQITKVDGVNAYSQIPSLYPGLGIKSKFYPQEGLNKETGKMPLGQFNPEPWREYVERNKMGFKSYPAAKQGKTPLVSPYPSGVETSTTWDYAVHTTVRDLKRELGRGMGARTNKYILELDIPTSPSPGFETLNILCQATSFPQRNMSVATVWRMGRKYNLRGEVDYGGSWTLTFVDDSELSIRRALDRWHIDIDDSKLQGTALNGLYDSRNQKLSSNEDLRFSREQGLKGYTLPPYKEYERSLANYQTDIKVFQLDQVGNRIMGYLMQNAFISEIAQIDYGDDQENQLTKFSCTITFSEFLPLVDHTMYFDIKRQY